MKTFLATIPFFLGIANAHAQFIPESVSMTLEEPTVDASPTPSPTPTPTPLMGVDGQFALSPWYQHSPNKPEDMNLKGRFRVDGWLNITQDGCLKVRARLTSGEKFNNEWINTGLGTSSTGLQVALRQLYVSASCLKNVTLEAGAVPVRNFGYMGLSDSGSIDGLRVHIVDEEHKREWIVSAGHVGPEASILNRNLDKLNHACIQVQQGIGKDLNVHVSASRYEGTVFARTGAQWAINRYVSWIKDLGTDLMSSDAKFVGWMGYADLTTKKWDSRIAFSSINPNPTDSDRLAFMMKQFFGYGKNLYLETSRDISKSLTVNARVRIGDAGPLALTGITWKVSGKRNRKPVMSPNP